MNYSNSQHDGCLDYVQTTSYSGTASNVTTTKNENCHASLKNNVLLNHYSSFVSSQSDMQGPHLNDCKTSMPTDKRFGLQIPSPNSAFPNQLCTADNGVRSSSMALMKPKILSGHSSANNYLNTTNGEYEDSNACSSIRQIGHSRLS